MTNRPTPASPNPNSPTGSKDPRWGCWAVHWMAVGPAVGACWACVGACWACWALPVGLAVGVGESVGPVPALKRRADHNTGVLR